MTDTARWEGVDKTVIEKVATEAGHPAREPYINTDQGDLLLFLFLLAGAIGGFIVGYAFRSLFPPRKTDNRAGTGPFLGEESSCTNKTSSENMDLSSSKLQGGQSHFRGGDVDDPSNVVHAAKIGTVPGESHEGSDHA
jgi:ABC-type cobalt transport system substrate-binding protein